jgi:hypothetical protein
LTEGSSVSRGSNSFLKSKVPLKRKIGGLARRFIAKEISRNTI